MQAEERYETALYNAYMRSTDVIVADWHRRRTGRKAGSRSAKFDTLYAPISRRRLSGRCPAGHHIGITLAHFGAASHGCACRTPVRRNVSPCVLSCTGYRNLNLIRATTWNGQDSTLRRTERERHERRLSHLKQSLIASAPASFETAAYRLSGRSPIRHGGLDWDNYRPALLSL